MTYKQFLARLRKTPRKWRLVEGRKIRCGNRCPMEVACGLRAGDYGIADIAGGVLKVEKIAFAADEKDRSTHTIRRDLLRACGLKEKA